MTSTFNARTQRARISSGWAHDSGHFQFLRQHDCPYPFAASRRPSTNKKEFFDALIGAVCGALLLLIVLLLGAI